MRLDIIMFRKEKEYNYLFKKMNEYKLSYKIWVIDGNLVNVEIKLPKGAIVNGISTDLLVEMSDDLEDDRSIIIPIKAISRWSVF